MTNFGNAVRTADTLLEVVRFIRDARTASRRSSESARAVVVPPSAPAVADMRQPSFAYPLRPTI